MKCPNCNETLLLSERYEIQIDYCPSCRGIWLDKGELDKMLDYAASKYYDAKHDVNNSLNAQVYNADRYHKDRNKKTHERRSFLGDLFDFD